MLHHAGGAIGRHHFAFLRALLDGIALEQAWRTYLSFAGEPTDRRQAVIQLRQLVDTLRRASAHQDRDAAAATAVRALRALPDLSRRAAGSGAGIPGHLDAGPVAAPPPTLDAWRTAQCGKAGIDEDFYTEAEWLALYAEHIGGDSALPAGAGLSGQLGMSPSPALPATAHARRAEAAHAARDHPRASDRHRQVLDGLAALETALARDAQWDDATHLWLAGRLPHQLAQVGVHSLGDLVQLIRLQGFRWHRLVQGLGVVRAHRLLDWLLPLAQAAGQPVPEASRRPETDLVLALQRQRATAVSAASAAPEPVDGPAADESLVRRWLDGHAGSTRRAYARVTERFLLWVRARRQTSLAALDAADLQAYLDFVRSPPADWVQTRRVRRDNPDWRPFQGPLGPVSQKHEMAVLASLLGDLQAAGRLCANPAAEVQRPPGAPAPSAQRGGQLGEDAWRFALQVLHEKPDTPARRRLQLLLALLDAGLRPSEVAATRLAALRQVRTDDWPHWQLVVVGRQGARRAVPLPDAVVSLLARHHRDMDAAGLGSGPTVDPDVRRVQAPCPAPAPGPDVGTSALSSPQVHVAGRPLLGILHRPPPRRTLDPRGLPCVDRSRTTQADRYGALGVSAIGKLLQRFLRDVAAAASSRPGAPAADLFLAATGLSLTRSRPVRIRARRLRASPDSA